MQKLTTLFRQYAMWLQIAVISVVFLTLALSQPDSDQAEAEGYLEMLGNLSLPYLISGDRSGLQQSLNLIIQDSPVLEARVLNTENRPLVQVVNRSATEQSRSLAVPLATELVLDQTLLGTLSISMPPSSPRSQPGLMLLLAAALAIGLGQLLAAPKNAVVQPLARSPDSRLKSRYLIAISLGPLIEQMKQQGGGNSRLHLIDSILRRLAPSYGLEFVAIDDENMYLQSNSDDKLSLRQAVVFAWNTCQSLGADRGLNLRSSISVAELPGDPLSSNLNMLAGEQLENCAELMAGSAAGTVSFGQELAATLPAEWDTQWESGKQQCVINELPAGVCNLWRRQLSNLAEK